MNWPTIATRRLFRIVNGGTPTVDPDNWGGPVKWATPVDLSAVNGTRVGDTKRTLSHRGLITGSGSVPAGSLILSTRAPIGYVAETVGETAFNQGCRGLVPKVPADIRFFRYQYFAFADSIASHGLGSTFMELSSEALAEFQIIVPPRGAQKAIADFLDAETTRIDNLIEGKRRMIALLEERVECLIRHRIADSTLVDPNAKNTTTTVRKALAKQSRQPALGGEMITAFRDGQVTARSLRRAVGFTQSWTENSRVQGVHKGDVVVHGLDGFAGAIGTAEVDGVCSPVYHVCTPTHGGDATYLGRMLQTLATDGYLGLFASSTRERAVDFRNWDLFGRIPIPEVRPSEQKEVGDSIRKIAPLKLAVERSAELAQERKQALITAVVTGEMTVPGVSK